MDDLDLAPRVRNEITPLKSAKPQQPSRKLHITARNQIIAPIKNFLAMTPLQPGKLYWP